MTKLTPKKKEIYLFMYINQAPRVFDLEEIIDQIIDDCEHWIGDCSMGYRLLLWKCISNLPPYVEAIACSYHTLIDIIGDELDIDNEKADIAANRVLDDIYGYFTYEEDWEYCKMPNTQVWAEVSLAILDMCEFSDNIDLDELH